MTKLWLPFFLFINAPLEVGNVTAAKLHPLVQEGMNRRTLILKEVWQQCQHFQIEIILIIERSVLATDLSIPILDGLKCRLLDSALCPQLVVEYRTELVGINIHDVLVRPVKPLAVHPIIYFMNSILSIFVGRQSQLLAYNFYHFQVRVSVSRLNKFLARGTWSTMMSSGKMSISTYLGWSCTTSKMK